MWLDLDAEVAGAVAERVAVLGLDTLRLLVLQRLATGQHRGVLVAAGVGRSRSRSVEVDRRRRLCVIQQVVEPRVFDRHQLLTARHVVSLQCPRQSSLSAETYAGRVMP